MARRLQEWEAQAPGTKASMLKALSQVRPSRLLDKELFDFVALTPQGEDKDVP